ncbi:tape measure protein [Ornithinibacillus bavariensis]|uniref:tape measure protein n=1 Tax=Ornithinibacillus bavariensis TaxID=545502 RepID=UPI000EE98B82|nr:hypothetical protein [Ornithinibacillus sp.]
MEAYLKATGADQFSNAFKNAAKNIDGLERSTGNAGITIGKLIKAAGGLYVLKKGFDMVRNSIDGAISRYDTLNNFPRVLQQIGFSATDSKKAINKLSDGIQGLPTTLDDVAGTTQRIAVLTNDLGGAVDTTLALNNAFISSGSNAANASRGLDQYVQMLSKGEVDLQSWRTLQETMGVALNDVAKAFGYAGASAQNDLYEALKSGDITFDQFNKKLIELNNQTGGFADRALTASGGIRTAWTNMKTAVVRGVTNIIAAIDEFLADTSLQSIENIITNMGKKFFNVLDGMAKAVKPTAKAIAGLYKALKPLAPVIAGVVAGLVAFQIVTVLTPGVKALAGAIALLRNPLFLAHYGFLALNASIRANPIGWIVGLLVGLVTVITILWKTNETFRNIVLSVWGAIKSAFKSMETIISAVAGYFVKLGSSIKPFIGSLKSGAVNAFNKSMDWLGNIVGVVSGYFSRFKDSINLKGVLTALTGPLVKVGTMLLGISGPIGWLISGFAFLATKTNILSDVIKVFKGEMEFSEAISNAADMSVGFINNMTDMLVKAIDVGADIVVKLIEGISKSLPGLVEKGVEILTKIIDTIVAQLPKLLGIGVEILTKLIDGIVTALPTIVGASTKIIQTLVETITSMLPTLIEIATTVLTTILDTWVSMLPMLIEIGITILTTLINVFIENLPMIIEAGITILTTLLDVFMENLPMIIGAAIMIITTLIDVLIENLPMIIDAGIQLLTALIDGVIEILPALIDAALLIITALFEALIDNLPVIIDAGIKVLMALIEGIIDVLPMLIETGLELVVKLGGALIKALPQILEAGVKIVWELIKGLGSIVWELLKAGGELVMNIIEGIGNFFKNIFNKGKELGGKVLDGLLNIRKKFLDAGKNIVQSIADGIKGAIGKVKDAIGKVTQKIRDFLPFSPAKEGALRDIMKIQIPQSIAESIDKGKRTAVQAMANLTSAINGEMPAVDIGGQIARTNRSIQTSVSHSVNQNNGRIESLLEKIANSNQVIILDSGALVGATYNQYDRMGGNQTMLNERWGR